MSRKKKAQEYFRQNDPRVTVWESKGIKWVMHHIDPSWKTDNPKRYNQWNIEDLLPMTKAAHTVIHHTGFVYSEETRKKMREHSNNKGENNPMYGRRHTEETKKKMSDSKIGVYKGENNPFYGKHHSEESRQKNRESHLGENSSVYGTHWYNNGIICIRLSECPEGFVPGRLMRKGV